MTAEALLPYTAWEFVAIVGGLMIAGIMYGAACHFLRLYRAGMKKDAAAGCANGSAWHTAGCAVSAALGTIMLITVVVAAAAALGSDPYDGSVVFALLFIQGTVMCFLAICSALWIEFDTLRGRVLSTGIIGLMSVALYASGLLIMFGLMPEIDWCTIFVCEVDTAAAGGDLTK